MASLAIRVEPAKPNPDADPRDVLPEVLEAHSQGCINEDGSDSETADGMGVCLEVDDPGCAMGSGPGRAQSTTMPPCARATSSTPS